MKSQNREYARNVNWEPPLVQKNSWSGDETSLSIILILKARPDVLAVHGL